MGWLMSIISRKVVARYLSAGDVVPFGGGRVKNPHFIKIHGDKYYLSNDGGPLGTPEDHAELAGNPRVIMGPGSDKFKYLWVLDTDRKTVVMWRAHDGNEKVWERASSMAHKIVQLDKKGQLNRVTHEEFLVIERAMLSSAHDNEAALKQYIADNESDVQKQVNELTQQYFDTHVLPEIETGLEAVRNGATPFGWKPFGGPEADPERQKMTSVMSSIMGKLFTVPKVELFLKKHGIDLDAPGADIQAAEWAVNDVLYAAYDRYLPSR
jgi:hypothetical protein